MSTIHVSIVIAENMFRWTAEKFLHQKGFLSEQKALF